MRVLVKIKRRKKSNKCLFYTRKFRKNRRFCIDKIVVKHFSLSLILKELL